MEKSTYDASYQEAYVLCMSLKFEEVQAVLLENKNSIKKKAYTDCYKQQEQSIFLYKEHLDVLKEGSKETCYIIGLQLGASNNQETFCMLLKSIQNNQIKSSLSTGYDDGKSIGVIAEVRNRETKGFSR